MINQSQLRKKIEQGMEQTQGILDTHKVIGNTFKDHTDFKCVMAQYNSLIRQLERMDLYLENFEKDNEIFELREEIKKFAQSYEDSIITFCLPTYL